METNNFFYLLFFPFFIPACSEQISKCSDYSSSKPGIGVMEAWVGSGNC